MTEIFVICHRELPGIPNDAGVLGDGVVVRQVAARPATAIKFIVASAARLFEFPVSDERVTQRVGRAARRRGCSVGLGDGRDCADEQCRHEQHQSGAAEAASRNQLSEGQRSPVHGSVSGFTSIQACSRPFSPPVLIGRVYVRAATIHSAMITYPLPSGPSYTSMRRRTGISPLAMTTALHKSANDSAWAVGLLVSRSGATSAPSGGGGLCDPSARAW